MDEDGNLLHQEISCLFLHGRKESRTGKVLLRIREQQAAKDPLRNVENAAHDVITPRQNNLFFTFLVITTTVLIKETVRDGVARNCKWNEERSE